MSRTIQIPEKFFKEIAVKDKLYSRIWFYWISNCVDEIFEPDFIEKQQKLYPSIDVEILDIYNFGIQLLQQDFRIIDKKKRKQYDDTILDQAKKVLDYLNDKAQTSFMYKKSNLEIISARLSEGFILSDFYKVIDKKVQDWRGTDWAKYLRPITLFNKTKFENYLNGADPTTTSSNKVSKFAESISKAKQIMGLHKDS